MKMATYLIFDGDCKAAFEYYARVLGGRIDSMASTESQPETMDFGPEWKGRIMHAEMSIGDDVLMGSDRPAGEGTTPQGFSVQLEIDDVAEAERIFGALAEGGAVEMPFEATFWAKRFGTLVDRFGIPWMINCGRFDR